MKLSTKGRYAVMAMADLAQFGVDSPAPLAEIAARQEISLSYLEQIFARLRKARLVISSRGPGGGYRLARSAAEIRIADIVLAANEPVDVTRCQHGVKGCIKDGGRCLTHDLWDELGRHIQVFLSAVSLADVVDRRVLGASSRLFAQHAPRSEALAAE